MLRVLKAFFPAILVAYVLASVSSTQIILAEVAGMGPTVTLTDRSQATLHDLLGLASSYLVLILVAFAIAMPVAAGLVRLLPGRRLFWFTLAGFVAVLALHLIMKSLLGVSGIAATRSLTGLLIQGVAGAAGGATYAWLSRPRPV